MHCHAVRAWGITRWKVEPLKCRGLPERPMPFSPVHRQRCSGGRQEAGDTGRVGMAGWTCTPAGAAQRSAGMQQASGPGGQLQQRGAGSAGRCRCAARMRPAGRAAHPLKRPLPVRPPPPPLTKFSCRQGRRPGREAGQDGEWAACVGRSVSTQRTATRQGVPNKKRPARAHRPLRGLPAHRSLGHHVGAQLHDDAAQRGGACGGVRRWGGGKTALWCEAGGTGGAGGRPAGRTAPAPCTPMWTLQQATRLGGSGPRPGALAEAQRSEAGTPAAGRRAAPPPLTRRHLHRGGTGADQRLAANWRRGGARAAQNTARSAEIS